MVRDMEGTGDLIWQEKEMSALPGGVWPLGTWRGSRLEGPADVSCHAAVLSPMRDQSASSLL